MEHLGTLLLQQGCWDEAAAILEQLNYTHCLGRSIINYDVNLPALATFKTNVAPSRIIILFMSTKTF